MDPWLIRDAASSRPIEVSKSSAPYDVYEIKEDIMSSVSGVTNQPQTTAVQKTDNQPAAVEAKKEEVNQQPAGAKPAADSTPQKAEHAMEGQARAAQLDASLNQAADQAKVDENAKFINGKLSYGVTDLAVTDQDVKDVRDKLDSLPP